MDRTSLVEKHLKAFKESEDSYLHTAVILSGHKRRQEVVSTWSTIPLVRKNPPTDPPEDLNKLWDWLWTSVQIDWTAFSIRTGIAKFALQQIFEPLRSNHLIYPDGTVSGHALGVLNSEVLKSIKASKKASQED